MVSSLHFVPAAFLWRVLLLNAELEHSRSDLVFKQSKSRDNFILGMLYLSGGFIICAMDICTRESEVVLKSNWSWRVQTMVYGRPSDT